MVRLEYNKCSVCKGGKMDWIGVMENGDRKMHCPLCHRITILDKIRKFTKEERAHVKMTHRIIGNFHGTMKLFELTRKELYDIIEND
jgi:hypothetical protein